MMDYRCYWIIDVSADSAKEAAHAAEAMRASLRDQISGTGVWNVLPDGPDAVAPGIEIHGVKLL
jgi:hypothetical protein